MKNSSQVVRMVTILVYIAFSVLGVFVGLKTYRNYGTIINGILGLVMFYLLYKVFLSPRLDRSKNDDFVFAYPKFQYLIFTFFWTVIIYWSYREISTMVLSLLGK